MKVEDDTFFFFFFIPKFETHRSNRVCGSGCNHDSY